MGTTGWKIRHIAPAGAIDGFADRVSVLPGQPFRLFVSTTARTWRVEAFRMGWYGGAQARRVWESAAVRTRHPGSVGGPVVTTTRPEHWVLSRPAGQWWVASWIAFTTSSSTETTR